MTTVDEHGSYATYTGYQQTATPTEDRELTEVFPGTPGGEYLRRFWHPVAVTSEITDVPRPVRVLGEDLVLFRDLSGRYGLLHRHCAHRQASLEYGKCERHGLRCCYHGWLYDVDGTLLEAPGEPPDTPLTGRVRQGAYPVEVRRGIVFAYLGPPEHVPEFPVYDTFDIPGTEMVPYTSRYDCNWLQVVENAMDPVHSVFLHSRVFGPSFSDAWGRMTVREFHETPGGFFYTNARRTDGHVWVRVHHVVLPNFTQAGAVLSMDGSRPKYFGRPSFTRWVVPVDDENTRVIAWANFSERADPPRAQWMTPESIEIIEGAQRRSRPRAEALRKPGDHEAVVSQGRVTSRAREHLGTTDKGVAMFRRRLRADIRALEQGGAPHQMSQQFEAPIPTYAGDHVLALTADDKGDDEAFVLDTSRRVVEILRAADRLKGAARDDYVCERVRALESGPESFGG